MPCTIMLIAGVARQRLRYPSWRSGWRQPAAAQAI